MANSVQRIQTPLIGGEQSNRDRKYIEDGALQVSVGAEYVAGDIHRVHRIGGRSLYGTLSSGNVTVDGLYFAAYDNGNSYLLAQSYGDLYYADATQATTATFTTLTSGRTTGSPRMSFCHFNNKYFVCNGVDQNVVVKQDASIYVMGLQSPAASMTIQELTGGQTITRPDTYTSTGSWTDLANSVDVTFSTFARNRLNTLTTEQAVWYWTTFSGLGNITNTGSRVVNVHMYLSGWNWDQTDRPLRAEENTADSDYTMSMSVDISTNSGSSWTNIYQETWKRPFFGIKQISYNLADGVGLVDTRIRASNQYLGGGNAAIVRYYDINVNNGKSDVTVTATAPIYYVYTEYDSNENRESVPSPIATVTAGDAFTGLSISLPGNTPTNAAATHYKIYRTYDDLDTLSPFVASNLGYVSTVPKGTEYFKDTFDNGITTRLIDGISLIQLDIFGEKQYYPANSPPPKATWMGNFGGSLFGLTGRTYRQSLIGNPESWPEIFVIARFPFRENSELLAGWQVGDRLWIGSRAGIIVLDRPISIINGFPQFPSPDKLEGAPGLVGPYACTPFSFNGEPYIAWASNFGIYVSNMVTYERITDDINWVGQLESGIFRKATGNSTGKLEKSVLRWLPEKKQLIYIYDSDADGTNDRFALIHMSEDHRNQLGRPKITWGHYGKFSDLAQGYDGSNYIEFVSGSATSKVWRQATNYGSDESNSYDTSSNVPFQVRTGRKYFPGADVGVRTARIYHNCNTTVTLTCQLFVGQDDDTTSVRTMTYTVPINGNRSKQVNVIEAGEYLQWDVQNIGTSTFSLGIIEQDIDAQDKPGEVY